MKETLRTRKEKAEFIINHLEKMKGLEFIDNYEIGACDMAIRVLKEFMHKDE